MFPQKAHKSTLILVTLILTSLICVLAGGGNVQAALPMTVSPQETSQVRTASLMPEFQEVTLGEEYRSEDGSFSFLTIPNYIIEEEYGFVTMSAPDADPDLGPFILFGNYPEEEDLTAEQLLAEFRQSFEGDAEISEEREIVVDGVPGLAVDIVGTDVSELVAGRLVVVATPPAQGFIMMGGAPAERWTDEMAPLFEAVVASISFAPEPEISEPFVDWTSYTNANYVRDMALEEDGSFWTAGPGGVVRWQSDGTYTKYTMDDGLAHNAVNAVAVDLDGAVWFGTDLAGVSRFDGQEWTTYTEEDGLGDNTVRAIIVAPDGTLWFGHRGVAGVSHFDGQKWTVYTEEDGLAENYVNDIAVAPDDTIWFSTDEGLSHFDGRSWTTYTTADGLPESSIDAVTAAPDGTIWVGTGDGAARFDGQEWTVYTEEDGLASNRISDIEIDPDGIVWFGHPDSGISGFDGQAWATFSTEDGLADSSVNDIFSASDGLWIGYDGAGFSFFDGATWSTYVTADALPANEVNAAAVAPDGAVWLGTDRGLARFDGLAWTTYTRDDGLPGNVILAVAAAPDGAIWTGTNFGLARFDGLAWTTYTEEDGLTMNHVPALAVAPDGTVWAGTWLNSEGVSSFDGQEWTTYTEADGLVYQAVTDIAVTPDGTVWFATAEGVSSFDGQAWSTYLEEDGLGDNWVNDITVAPDGALWFATRNGASRFDGQEWTNYPGPEDSTFSSVAATPDGAILVGSESFSIDMYCFVDQIWNSCSQGLVDNAIKDIAVSPNGSIWVATSGGVSGYMPGGISASTGKILFEDRFDSNQHEWTIGEETDEYGLHTAEIVDGRYRLSQQAEKGVFSWEEPVDANFDDFTLSVEASPVEYSASFAYGLVFRSGEEKELYTFQIDTDGFFYINLLQDGEWQKLVDFTEMDAINIDGPNQLAVTAIGPSLTFFVNGQEAITLEDETLDTGSIGVGLELYEAGDSATVDFDNLIVRQIGGATPEEIGISGEIIFADYFDSDANGWATGEFEDQLTLDEIAVEEGVYRMMVTAKEPAYVEKVLPNQEFSDFVLTVEATPHDTAEHYSYGLAFREDDELNSYTFEIGNDGLYNVQLYDGEWHTLKDWSSTDAINVGQTNRLMVIADGSTLTFFVNGVELTQIQDDTLSAGTVGLIVDVFEGDTVATVDFDNLIINSVESME